MRPWLLLILIVLLGACSTTPSEPTESSSMATDATGQTAVQGQTGQAENAVLDPDELDEAARWRWQDKTERWEYLGAETPPDVAAEAWGFGDGAITLKVRASDQLNAFDGKPHTLVLRVLQLNGRRDFEDVRKTRSGIRDLLLASEVEQMGAGVVAMEERLLRPGETTTLVLDRTADTRYLAMVAGYYSLNGETSTRLVTFPALDDTVYPGFSLLGAMTAGLLSDDVEPLPRRPGRLLIDVQLDSQAIGSVGITAL